MWNLKKRGVKLRNRKENGGSKACMGSAGLVGEKKEVGKGYKLSVTRGIRLEDPIHNTMTVVDNTV